MTYFVMLVASGFVLGFLVNAPNAVLSGVKRILD